MSKVTVFLNKNTLQNIKELSNNLGQSLSKTASELVEIGYKKRYQDAKKSILYNNNFDNLSQKHTEYLLRILNINVEILRKLYNEPSRCTKKTVDLMLDEITYHVKNRLENK